MHAPTDTAVPSPTARREAGPPPRAWLTRMTAAALMTLLVIGLYPFAHRDQGDTP